MRTDIIKLEIEKIKKCKNVIYINQVADVDGEGIETYLHSAADSEIFSFRIDGCDNFISLEEFKRKWEEAGRHDIDFNYLWLAEYKCFKVSISGMFDFIDDKIFCEKPEFHKTGLSEQKDLDWIRQEIKEQILAEMRDFGFEEPEDDIEDYQDLIDFFVSITDNSIPVYRLPNVHRMDDMARGITSGCGGHGLWFNETDTLVTLSKGINKDLILEDMEACLEQRQK